MHINTCMHTHVLLCIYLIAYVCAHAFYRICTLFHEDVPVATRMPGHIRILLHTCSLLHARLYTHTCNPLEYLSCCT